MENEIEANDAAEQVTSSHREQRLVRPDAFRVKCSPHWSPREMEVIEQLAIAKEIEPCHVVRCALRLYQMEYEGTITVARPKPIGCPDFPDKVSGTNAGDLARKPAPQDSEP